MDHENFIWGIDLGGTKIEGVVLKSDSLDVLSRRRISTEADQGYEHILSRISKLIYEISGEVGFMPVKIGIGTPGSIDPQSGLLKNSNTVVLNGTPFLSDLEAQLGIPVVMANDANCFALAEATMGAVPEYMPDAQIVFGIIMGTGVGGGIVIEGKVLSGAQGIGGEWGHTFLDDSGGDCYCGKVGCVERILSGSSLERYYLEETGESLKLMEIIERHIKGDDSSATKTIERLLHFFGKGLANVINILDPDIIVVGGGVGNIDLLYSQGVEYVKQSVFNTSFITPIVRPKLGDSAGVFGAALLVT